MTTDEIYPISIKVSVFPMLISHRPFYSFHILLFHFYRKIVNTLIVLPAKFAKTPAYASHDASTYLRNLPNPARYSHFRTPKNNSKNVIDTPV